MENIYAIVNYIFVANNEIVVGVTDSERWGWDTEEGYSGADARTMVWVILKLNGPGIATAETVGFYCGRTEILRELAYASIPKLFEIAWEIEVEKMTNSEAVDKFFGMQLNAPNAG
jgi:hypothetical protein